MKTRFFTTAVVLAAVMPLSAQSADIGKPKLAVPSMQLNPQPEPPRPLRGMTELQFQALPPTASVIVNNKPYPKSEVQKVIEQLKTGADASVREFSQKQIAKLQKQNSELLAQQKSALQAGNTALKTGFSAMRGAPGKAKQQSAKTATQLLAPQILETRGANGMYSPYGWVAIHGANFGNTAGKVTLDLTSGGSKTLTVKEWYDDAILVDIPYFDSVPDQQAKLVVTAGSQSATKPVFFTAFRETKFMPLSVSKCDTKASFHNSCTVNSNIFHGEHTNFIDDQTVITGTDVYQVKPLKLGWKYTTNPLVTSDICTLSGSTITCSWSTPKQICIKGGCFNVDHSISSGNVIVEGPAGMDP